MDANQTPPNAADLAVSSIGTTSTRKGAASYLATGTTATGQLASIYLRGGWSLGKPNLDRYLFRGPNLAEAQRLLKVNMDQAAEIDAKIAALKAEVEAKIAALPADDGDD
jgi:hypothetical protein